MDVKDMVDYEKLTVAELKDILLKKGLPFTGKKSVLIQRIVDSEKMTVSNWLDKKFMHYFVLLIAIMFIATLLFDPNGIFGCCGLIVLFFVYNDGVKEEEKRLRKVLSDQWNDMKGIVKK